MTRKCVNDLPKVKGLSLRQPWAEQIMRGEKTVDYRQRSVAYRGPIYNYASLGRFSPDEEAEFAAEVGYDIANLPRGVVIGTAEITGCFDEGDGSFVWTLDNTKRMDPLIAPIEKPQPIWFHPFGRPQR